MPRVRGCNKSWAVAFYQGRLWPSFFYLCGLLCYVGSESQYVVEGRGGTYVVFVMFECVVFKVIMSLGFVYLHVHYLENLRIHSTTELITELYKNIFLDNG